MIRLLLFLVLLLALTAGLSWLADHPGTVSLVWMGTRVETSVLVFTLALLVLAAVAMLVLALLRGLIRLPRSLRRYGARRRRERGWRAVSEGMVAVGTGDIARAERAALDARRLLPSEPLALLLEAQSAQLSGDREHARRAFERMAENPETRLLALRGLFIEAQRRGETGAARHFAEEVVRAAPDLPWAGTALLEYQAQDRDWTGALATLESNARHRVIDKERARRLKAVLLTARGLEMEAGEPDKARALALEAHAVAPDLAPAAALAARLLVRAGDVRRATRVLEATWRLSPHPDVAAAYIHVRPGDSAQDRLKRARDLAALRPNEPEGIIALAQAALDAQDPLLARETLAPLLGGPAATRRVYRLMAQVETAEHGETGRAREWLARAAHATRDPAWVADGFVSEEWLPVSPVSGRLDVFEWTVPPERLSGPLAHPADELPGAEAAALPAGADDLSRSRGDGRALGAPEPAHEHATRAVPGTGNGSEPGRALGGQAAAARSAPAGGGGDGGAPPVAPDKPAGEPPAEGRAPPLTARDDDGTGPRPAPFPMPRPPDDPGVDRPASGNGAEQRPPSLVP